METLDLLLINLGIDWETDWLWYVVLFIGFIAVIVDALIRKSISKSERNGTMKNSPKISCGVVGLIILIVFGCAGFFALQLAPMATVAYADRQAGEQMQTVVEDVEQAQMDQAGQAGGGVTGQELITILRDQHEHDEAMAREISRVALAGDVAQTTTSVTAIAGNTIVYLITGAAVVLGLFILMMGKRGE